ncbi:MAG: PAS domain-containing protein [Bacteroidales bacterium]|nr:PAS domain-containing protein [Bacteroidales bacterium]
MHKKISGFEREDQIKTVILGILLAICVFLTYYSCFILKSDIIFTHFFYVPIIFASMWRVRLGPLVSVFLAIMLLISHLLSQSGSLEECLLRASMFVVIGLVSAGLNEKKQFLEERLQIVTALRKTEMKNQALLNAIPDLVFEITREGIFKNFKPGSNVDLYVPLGEFLGKNIYDVMPPDIARQGMILIERTLQTGRIQKLEYQLPIEGLMHYYEGLMAPLTKDEVIFAVRDIT